MSWIDIAEHSPPLLYGTTVLLGLVAGSFLNVVILRLPRMLEAAWTRDCAELAGDDGAGTDHPEPARISLAHPPSTCTHCGHRIRAYENIPLLSYLLLGGRCSACGGTIGVRYPLVEGFTAVLTVAVILHFGLSVQTAPALLLTWALIALAVIDYDTQLLPDSMTLPLVWLGLILSLFGVFTDSHSAIIGAVAGYLSLWIVFHLFRLITGKEGMGYGDFKLLAVLGAWLGWQSLPQIVLLSAFTGASLGVILILSGRHARGSPIPFGPFLAVAGWISLIWGEQINRVYLQTVGLG
ncbi:MAG: A24 family peptidase [Thiocapsa sp.]|jgi:leader peptidase (prepilin peptidase)/N-methyltransferase|nr:A24 family peptidase [Thiocapsa sp.]MCG6896960.1 A24 family peptidase [Thiocapsa sp.]MCG6985960.1 A24 family peptidase [Thiocapsa sp.]